MQFDPGGGGELTHHFKITKNKFPITSYKTCLYLYKTVFTFAVGCLVAAVEKFEKNHVSKSTFLKF